MKPRGGKMKMDKELQKDIADYIQSETKGGYLQDWGEVSLLMSREQQRDYFLILAKHIQVFVKKAGYRKVSGKLPVLSDKEIGDLLDLEKEYQYLCSDGGITTTIDIRPILQAYRTKVKKWLDL